MSNFSSLVKLFLATIGCWLTTLSLSVADIRLPHLLGNNMVLQRERPVKLWGWADPGEVVRVTPSWNGKTDSVVASGDGHWELRVPTPSAGGPYTIEFRGHNTIELTNVLIGEVWVCSGQSNMAMNGTSGLADIRAEKTNATHPNIRFFKTPRASVPLPAADCTANWQLCDSTTLNSFSAVGYFFGKRLADTLAIPIGLIEAAWGGTSAEVWTPADVLSADTQLSEIAKKIPPSDHWPTEPGLAYNGMIAPLTPFEIAGVIWYQGENNVGPYSANYHRLFSTLIHAWRTEWRRSFPFYYVQIAPYHYPKPLSAAVLREAQTKVLALPNTAMVLTTDLVTDTNNVHPTNKKDVGLRLANTALVKHYKLRGISYEYPTFHRMRIRKNRIVVTLKHADGLTITQPGARDFLIAGADGIFHPAEVTVQGNSVIFWNATIKNPVAVRYGFDDTATASLVNHAGMPAAPFRTDRWAIAGQRQ